MEPASTSLQDRKIQILTLLTDGDSQAPLVERICEVSAHLLDVSGAGMCLIGGRRHQVIVHGTDPLIQQLEDLQVVYGQGPCIEAVETGSPVLVADLASYRPPSWQLYADEALARGVQAVFAFPIGKANIVLGALDLYRLSPGPLTAEQFQDAAALTQIAAHAMLAQSDDDTLDGSVGALYWLRSARSAAPGRRGGATTRGRPVDLGITVEQALAPGRHDPSETSTLARWLASPDLEGIGD